MFCARSFHRQSFVGLSLLLFVSLILGCGPRRPAELATLELISPREFEVGEQFTLEGTGFVVGPATLELVGTLSSPGRSRRSSDTTLRFSVLATSTTRATARFSRRHIEQLNAPHTTFSGHALLRFESQAGPHAPPVVANLSDIRLELFSSTLGRQGSPRENRRRGEAFLEELGVTGVVLPEGRGVLIERIVSSSTGARAGLRPGEVIVTAGEVTVSSVSDLAPPPRSSRSVLGLRNVNGDFRRVACPLNAPTQSPDADRLAAIAIAAMALLFMLASAGPLRGPLRWLGKQLALNAGGPREFLGQLADEGRTRPLHALVALALFAASPFIVMAVAHLSVVPIAGGVVLVGVIAASAPRRGWRRLAAFFAAPRALPLIALAAIGALHGASTNLINIVSAQGAAPWRWTALADPGIILTVLIAGSITCSAGPTRPGPATALHHGLVGALIVAAVFGGWNAPGDQELMGQLVFAGKAWLVGISVAFGGRGRSLVAIPLAAPAVALSVALVLLPLPDWTATASTWAAAAALGFIAFPIVLRHVLTPRREAARHKVARDPRVAAAPVLPPDFEVAPGHS